MSKGFVPVDQRNALAIVEAMRNDRERADKAEERADAMERQLTALTLDVSRLEGQVTALLAEVAAWR